MPLNQGQILVNRYRVAKQIAKGGFGTVYRGWDLNLNRPCAIKECLETTVEVKQQFEREATILANLNHPNLVRVTDFFSIPGTAQFLIMDFVEG